MIEHWLEHQLFLTSLMLVFLAVLTWRVYRWAVRSVDWADPEANPASEMPQVARSKRTKQTPFIFP